jgi:hypothetical protein
MRRKVEQSLCRIFAKQARLHRSGCVRRIFVIECVPLLEAASHTVIAREKAGDIG